MNVLIVQEKKSAYTIKLIVSKTIYPKKKKKSLLHFASERGDLSKSISSKHGITSPMRSRPS